MRPPCIARLAAILPARRLAHVRRGDPAVRMRWPDAVPCAGASGAAAGNRRRRWWRSWRRATRRACPWWPAARAPACRVARCADVRGVVLSLARFNRILSIDPLARSAVVQPGVRNLAISQAAAAYGLYYAPDPSSQLACSIGGNVAENSGGVHCLKYGLTVHNVRRVRAVLITGDVVELGGEAARQAPGYDLLALITGSEGLLGVITEVTVKLLPKPPLAQCVLAAFADVERAGAAVAAIIGAGIVPAGLEMMDQRATRVRSGRSLRACELSAGCSRRAARRSRRHAWTKWPPKSPRSAEPPHRGRRHRDPRVVRDEKQRLLFWSGRKAAFPRRGPHLCARLLLHRRHHSPRGALPACAAAASKRGRRNSACRAPTCSMRATATCIR